MKKLALGILLICLGLSVRSQQVGMASHAFYKPMINNPAYTGKSENVNAMLISRSQWTGFRGAPQLNLLTIDGSLMEEKAGIGLSFISDKKGLNKRAGGYLNYAYRVKINDNSSLRFGIALGVIDHTIDYTDALVENSSDPFLFGSTEHKTAFDANAGLVLILKEFELGVSAPQLFGNKISYVDNKSTRANYLQTRHYLASLKYGFLIAKEKKIYIVPQALVRIVPNSPFQYEGTINLDWRDKLWIGATYKSNYALVAHAGVCLYKQLSIGYAYDFIMGDLANYSGISHEIMVSFKFGKNKSSDQELTPVIEASKNDPYERRLDSLQEVLSANQTRLAEDQKKITELNNKLDQQAKQIASQAQVQQNASQALNSTQPVVTQQQPPAENQNNTIQENSNSQENKQSPSGNNNNTGNNNNNANNNQQNNSNQNAAALETNSNKTMNNGIWFVTNSAKDFKDQNDRLPQKGFYVIAGTFTYRDFAEAEVKRLSGNGYKANWMFFTPKQFNYVYIAKPSSREEALKKAEAARKSGIKDAWVLQLTE
jgi:type IX secretion system PorP/SprF family membrane protein